MQEPPFHVWVSVSGWEGSVGISPGILTEWRRVPAGGRWEAYVIYGVAYSTGSGTQCQVTQGWVRAEHVRPVDPPPRIPR
jgi:hypothetical protein